MGAANEGEFYGYALIFGHPKASLIRYCHKIYVHEQYRGHGIGSQMLEALLSQPYEMGLLCSSELVPFYEAAGMVNKGIFSPQIAVILTVHAACMRGFAS